MGKLKGPKPRPIEERFWEKVNKDSPDGCWLWTAGQYKTGYGMFYLRSGQSKVRAHRFAYELLVSPIPEGKELDHLCRNSLCVNPAHLEVVTHKENMRRGSPNGILAMTLLQTSKTHCPKGHPYDLFNTYHRPNGGRDCKACQKQRKAKYLTKIKTLTH